MKRKEQFDAENEWAPYNEIEIVGNSLVSEAVRDKEWQGQQGEAISIKPMASFGEVLDRPQGELERDYEVVSIPEEPSPLQIRRGMQPPPADGPSPEDTFRKAALDEQAEKTTS